MSSLFQEFKRRKVFRIAVIYAVVAWVLIQVADTIAPMMNLPESAPRLVLFLLIILFPIAVFLAWAYEITPEGIKADSVAQSAPTTSSNTDRKLIYATFALVLLVAGFQIADRFVFDINSSNVASMPNSSTLPETTQVTRALVSFGNMQYRPFENVLTNFDFTPDGNQLVYSSFLNGNNRLHVRNLAELEPQTIFQSNTLTAFSPRVSPDGQRIVFITASRDLYTLGLNGSATPTLVAQDVSHESYDWFGDRDVIFTESGTGKLQTVSVTGGTAQPVPLENSDERGNYKTPLLLPGGNFLIYSVVVGRQDSRVELLDLSTNQNRVLIENGFAAKYIESGHLTFMRDDNLMAVPFDLDQMAITGREVLMVSGIENFSNQTLAAYSVSSNGQLLYLPGADRFAVTGLSEYVRANVSGEQSAIENWPPGRITDPVLSPDGTRVALTINNEAEGRDIWDYHLERHTLSRVTYSGDSHEPLWSPDGQTLVFEDGRSGLGMWQINANGAGIVEKLMTTNSSRTMPKEFSPDGSKLIYMELEGSWDLNMLDFNDAENSQQPLINSEFTEWDANISPDGRWIAYKSDETGRFEVYVRSFPAVNSGKIQVSINGGREPQWSHDGNSLYYIDDAESTLVAVPVDLESGFTYGTAVTMASVAFANNDPPNYVLLPDDQSFLIQKPVEGLTNPNTPRAVSAVLVDNWFEELNRLAPPDQQ
jgi:eukaryotic-like serine/threonine-protein kinase